jgi:hypothetical protein
MAKEMTDVATGRTRACEVFFIQTTTYFVLYLSSLFTLFSHLNPFLFRSENVSGIDGKEGSQQDATRIFLFIDRSNLARHVSGNNSAHLQELLTVQYSLRYVVPNKLLVGDLVTEELRYQITDRQPTGYNIPQAVLHRLQLLKMGKIFA